MKKLSILNKLVFLLNSVIATLLLLSLFLPFISPKLFAEIAVISLLVPFLIIINIGFAVYWIILLKRQFLLSGIILIIFWLFSPTIYKFSKANELSENGIRVMSYNVRMFNHWKWIKEKNITAKIDSFISKTDPDIILFQEFYKNDSLNLNYPYQFIKTKKAKDKVGMAIFSKYPIINKGSFDFKETSNNIIFGDIVKENDTIRVYNFHLQSLQVNPAKVNFGEEDSSKLFGRLKNGFLKQVDQVEAFLSHEIQWNGKQVVAGDFNNTSFSWVYRQIAKDKIDAFEEMGSGFGKTYHYPLPLRIDFILTDDSASIQSFQNHQVNLSDHFPIETSIIWN